MATLEQVAEALKRADASGNVEDARALAAAYKQMVAQAQPQQQAADAPLPFNPGSPEYAELPVPGTTHAQPPPSIRSMIPGGEFLNAAADAFGRNIPIIGPATERAADFVGSNIVSAITGQPADELVADAQRVRRLNEEGQPLATTMGAVAGSVGPLMSVGTTQMGAKALGLTGPWWQRIMAGGASGGVVAGADAAVRGEDWDTVKERGLWGAGLGAAFPLAERVLSPVVNALLGRRASPGVQRVATNVEREGLDPASIRTVLAALGSDAVLADLGPNLSRQAAAIASLPGEGQTIVREALLKRQQGTNARVRSEVDDILGPAPIPSHLQTDIRGGQQALQPEYEEAFRHAVPVNTRPLAESLQDMAETAQVGTLRQMVDRLRSFLNETDDMGRITLSSDPRRLMAIRREIDIMMDGATSNTTRGFLTSARQQVDDFLAHSVPGIKEVDAKFEELARQSTGLGNGRTILGSGPEAPVPAEVAGMMDPQAASALFVGPSGAPFRVSQGARAEVERILGTKMNNLTSMKDALKGDGSWNRERLASVFGQEKADDLIAVLDREMVYNSTAQTALHNSETAARTAAQQEAKPYLIGDSQNLIADLLLKIPAKGVNSASRARSEAVNRQAAGLLMSQPSAEVVDALIAARLMNRGRIGSAVAPLVDQ